MNLKIRIVGLGLAVLLGGSAVAPPRAAAQNSSAEAGRRKVRTRVAPDYPMLAKHLNVTGRVKIEATVSTDGRVIATRVVGGSPLLVNAALDALKKWRFDPAAKESTELVEFDFTGQD